MNDLKARLQELLKAEVERNPDGPWYQAIALSLLSKLDQREREVVVLREALYKVGLQWCRGIHSKAEPCEVCQGAQHRVFEISKGVLDSTATEAREWEARVRREEREAVEGRVLEGGWYVESSDHGRITEWVNFPALQAKIKGEPYGTP